MSPSSTRRTQAERREETRAAILASARELFAAHGYHGCSVDQIIDGAGSSKGGFYHHFADKSAVLEALVVEFEEEGIRRAIEWSAGVRSVIEIMRRSVSNFLEWCTDPYIRQVMLIDSLSVLGHERWHAIDDAYTLDVLDHLLQRGIAQGEIRPLPSTRMFARLIIGASNEAALTVGNADDPDAARAEAVAAFDVIFESIAATG